MTIDKGENVTRSDIANALIKLLGDRPVAYHPMLAKILGGVKCALFVSQLLYWHGKGARPDGYIWKTQKEFEEETGLSRYEQETARKKLRKLGILFEKKHGIPAKLHYKLDTDKLGKLIVIYNRTSMRKSSKQESGNTANNNVEKQQCITETTTEITTDKISVLPNAESTDSDSTESRLDNRGIFIHQFVDNEYVEFYCVCGERLDARHLPKTKLKCPHCKTPIEIRDSSGKTIHKPFIGSKPKKVLGDIIPDCPVKFADIEYQTQDQRKRIEIVVKQNSDIFFGSLDWAVRMYVSENWNSKMLIDNAITAAARKIEMSKKVGTPKKGKQIIQAETLEPDWMEL